MLCMPAWLNVNACVHLNATNTYLPVLQPCSYLTLALLPGALPPPPGPLPGPPGPPAAVEPWLCCVAGLPMHPGTLLQARLQASARAPAVDQQMLSLETMLCYCIFCVLRQIPSCVAFPQYHITQWCNLIIKLNGEEWFFSPQITETQLVHFFRCTISCLAPVSWLFENQDLVAWKAPECECFRWCRPHPKGYCVE